MLYTDMVSQEMVKDSVDHSRGIRAQGAVMRVERSTWHTSELVD